MSQSALKYLRSRNNILFRNDDTPIPISSATNIYTTVQSAPESLPPVGIVSLLPPPPTELPTPPQPSPDISRPSPDVPQLSSHVPQPCPDAPQPCNDVPQPCLHVSQPNPKLPQPISDVPQPHPDIPLPCPDMLAPHPDTSIAAEPTVPNDSNADINTSKTKIRGTRVTAK